MKPGNIQLILLLSDLLFIFCVAEKTRPPNVLFIVADDLGWNDVSWHNPNIHSPSIEELAAGGVLLDQYYVQPTCSPSRVAFMTGRYPYRVGRQHMYIKPAMPAGIPTNVNIMPQYFQQAGYVTHAIGKWHLGFCHQNYTPTFRGFDTFYGFYLGSQDFYTHSSQHTTGYDFRINEKILKGPEVDGKYSTDLFVNRANAIFEHHKQADLKGNGKPWFTYLSFQAVHEPLQVPHSYKENVCEYKDQARYFYSAMVSSLDHAIDRVVESLKATGFYENTIIVFTTDNGGAVKMGGNNMPLRGTKGTLYEGGTRGIGFIHSPLLQTTGYTNFNMMHAVDWLPTLMSAIGQQNLATSATDGVDQWAAISSPSLHAPRNEIVYNIKEKPFMAAIRVGDHKLLWGRQPEKDIWFPAQESVVDEDLCDALKKRRTQADRNRSLSEARGMETMDVLNLNIDEDKEYAEEYEYLERIEEIDLEEQYGYDTTEEEDIAPLITSQINTSRTERILRSRNGRNKGNSENKNHADKKKKWNGKNKGGGAHKNKKGGKKKGGSGKHRKRIPIPNKYGATIKSWGETRLFNLREDPEERNDISADNVEIVEKLIAKAKEHFMNLYPQFTPKDDPLSNPLRWGGFWSPGWCDTYTIKDD